MYWQHEQIESLDMLGEELRYLRGDLLRYLERLLGESWTMLSTIEGEGRFIRTMDRALVYPSASELLGPPSTERVPYYDGDVKMPRPERLMDLLWMNFYHWQGHTIFRCRNSDKHDGHVWMAVSPNARLASRLGVCLRWMEFHSRPGSGKDEADYRISNEESCQFQYQPLANVLLGTNKPISFKDANPANLSPDNISIRKAGRPMKCAFCGRLTTKDQSQVIGKKRHCLACLGYAMDKRRNY